MTINGVDTRDYGMVVTDVKGAYDMPARAGEYVYDWGDEYQILFGPNYTRWAPRVFTVNFLYDPRVQTTGLPDNNYVDTFTQAYKLASPLTLGFTDKVGNIGEHTVYVKSIPQQEKYRNGNHKLTIVFIEPNPVFNGALPASKAGGSLTIDGYGLQQFKAKHTQISAISGLGEAINSKATQYTSEAVPRPQRALHTFQVEGYIIDDNPIVQMASLQKVLTQEKVLPFTYGNYSFDVICAGGITTDKRNDQVIKFTMNLIRL